MKKAFVFSLLATLAITGCQAELEELIPENNEQEVITQEPAKVFTAIVDDDFSGDTKTSLDGSGNVLWKQYDQVSIFAASTVNEQYQVSDDSDGKTAATLNKIPAGGFVAGTDIDNNVAFYPYASTASIAKSGSNYVISDVELPATQTYVAGSFGNGAFPMAAVTSSTEDMNLKFKNVLGGLKLQLKGTATITSITVTGNNDEILYGDAEVTMAYGGVPSISLSDATAKTVTLDCGAGVTLDSETATIFIIALPPMTMTGGFTVVVRDSESKQMEIKTTKSQTIPRSNLLKMPAVNYVGTVDYLTKPLTITSTGSTSVSIRKQNSPNDISLEYRIGSDAWSSYTIGSGIDLADGESLQFRAGVDGNATFGKTYSAYYYFYIEGTGTVEASGNIMSLLDRSLSRDDVPVYGFYYLFKGRSKLVNIENLRLPATVLASNCYAGMFYGCTELTSAPDLPATTLALGCYADMFRDCSKLSSAPVISATTMAQNCCIRMFYGCTGLSSPPALPATTLDTGCYDSMFRGCTGLTTAPELPATTLANSCYEYMFYGCTGLTSAPTLSASALLVNSYAFMFYGCSNLNYIRMLATDISGTQCLNSWVYGVSATGTFVKNVAAPLMTGSSGIPDGWTIETE